MTQADVYNLLEAAIPSFGRTTLTLAETPADTQALLRLLDRALAVGNRRGAPLVEIQAPLAVFPDLAGVYWHVPIEDSGNEGVVRLSFARPEMHDAA
ncbi:MAG: hypothetical protein ACK5JM_06555 [Rhodoblastus sp.]